MHRLLSTVHDDLLVISEQAWSGVMVFKRRVSRVSGDVFADLEDVLSKRMFWAVF